MANVVLYAFLSLEVLFVIGGILLVVLGVVTRAALNGKQSIDNVANTLLLSRGPLTAAIVNGALVFVAFLLCIPSLAASKNRTFLNIHSYAVVVCAIFTLVIGLQIWFQTLKTRSNLATVWGEQSNETQSLLQQQFSCCGYTNATTPPFIPDSVCTDALAAANLQGCIGPFSTFANDLLRRVFTTDFAIVIIDVFLLLGIACLVKDRKERERYALIDAKTGLAPI